MGTLLLYCHREGAGLAHPAGNKILYHNAYIYTHIDSDVFTTKGLLWRHLEVVCVRVWVCEYAVLYGGKSNGKDRAYNIIVFCITGGSSGGGDG